MAVGFFNPEGIFASLVGTSVGEVQTTNHSTSQQRAQAVDKHGDEKSSTLYGGQDSITETFKIYQESGTFSIANIVPGTVQDGYHVDNLTVTYTPTDYPEVSISAHKHTDTADGVTSHGTTHRKATASLTLPAGFGACGIAALVGVSDASIAVSGATYTIGITHEDATDCGGAYLASENRDPVETLAVNFVGIAEPEMDGWDMTASSEDRSNTAAETSSFTFEKHGTSFVASGSGSGSSAASGT